jgi:cytidylate kinase
VFDRQLCEVIAGDPALQATMEALLAEEYRSELTAFVETLCTGCAGQDRQYRKIFEVVRVLASIGKVILVGRAAAFVTRDLPGGIHVRLVAPEPLRVRWMMRKLSLERSAALKLIRRQDRDRDRMARRFFNADVADPLHYDAVWNSGKASPHEMSESIISMTRLRARQAEKARQEAEARND